MPPESPGPTLEHRSGVPDRRRPVPPGIAPLLIRHPRRRWQDDPDLQALFDAGILRIGAELHRLRTDRFWSIEELGAVSGVSVDTIEAVENGQTDPQWSTLVRLFYPFGRQVRLAFLTGGALTIPGYSPPKAVVDRV